MTKHDFRLWDRNNERMIFFNLNNFCDIKQLFDFEIDEKYLNLYLMRYTGMKDSKNQPIYEHDLLLINDNTKEEEKSKGYVFWDEKRLTWIVRINNIPFSLYDFKENCEVIGNLIEGEIDIKKKNIINLDRKIKEIIISNNKNINYKTIQTVLMK